MVYVTRKCGRCGKLIDCMTPDNDETKIGNPISECPNCGCIIFKRKTKEIIMFNIYDYIMYFFPKLFRALLISMIPCILIYLITNSEIICILACVAIVAFFTYKAIKRFNEEKLDSIKRTKDFNYLNLLYKTKCITKQTMEGFMDLYNIQEPSKK